MLKWRKTKTIIGTVLAAILLFSTIFVPLESVFAYDSDSAVAVTRGAYYNLPETVENYALSGKTLEFDLNFLIKSADNCKLRLYDGSTQVSGEFLLQNGESGLEMTAEPIEDGWYHYVITFLSVPHTVSQANSSVTRIRVATTFPKGSMINNISIGTDVHSLPETLTEDYDTVTLADLGITGTDYKSTVSSGTYTYKGKSATKSVVVKFGWEANITSTIDWKLALDTYWNANCTAWFRPDAIYFCPGDGSYKELYFKADAITSGKHDVEFGRMRVTAGPYSGKDYVFLKIDGLVRAYKYTDYYQTEGGYVSHNNKTVLPSYTVCFVNDGVAAQGFSGFGEPDKYVSDIDYVNIGDIVPGGVVKDTIHDNYLGYTYPFTGSSKTHSTVVKYVLKAGKYAEGNLDGSVMVVDIGGNCGFCRAYISSGNKKSIMFGWEIEGCSSGTKSYAFPEKSWYAFEQGRLRVTSGVNKGKDYIYLKIDGKIVSSFYGEPDSRPLLGDQIYVEATQNFQVVGYDEIRAKYYVDGELYLDSLAQKNLTVKQPGDPKKDGAYFLGWYTKESGGTLFDFANTKPKSDVNLYAHFTTETVTVTYDPANGVGSFNEQSGKDCLVTEPNTPSYSDGTYEYVFVGWKNKATGKMFDFATDRLSENTEFVAVYKEKEYFVSYYASGKLVEKVPFVLSNPTVSGKEPAVPTIPNTTGVWENHSVSGLKGNMTVNAVYTVKVPSSTTAVTLTKYSGGRVYLNTDTIHDFLSTDTDKQSDYVREFCAAPHEYQDYQNTSFAWADSGKNSKYTVYFADNTDFKDAYIVTAKSTSLLNKVGIFIPGKTYYWFVYGNDTGKSSAIDSFKVVNTPIRYITAGKVINMRDLGGQVNSEGRRVKYELVYRGAALDEYTSYVDDAARDVFNRLGINSEIELRGGMNHDYTGWDENNPNVNYIKGAMYQEILELDAEQIAQYKSTFEKMADINNYPFYFHCSAGADRTGTFAYLLYGLLGVSYNDIRPEYELTSFSAIGVRPADDYHNGFALDTTNSQMLEKYGDNTGNLQTAISNFLTSKIGLSAATINSIKNIMLDDASVKNEKPYILTVDVNGKKRTYKAFDGIYFMPDSPQVIGKIFKGFYNGNTKYNGYAKSDLNLTAKFEDISYEPYDTISLNDLGIEENKILNQTNKVYRYEKLVKGGTGGRLLQFILEPIGDMKGGDGPQIAITNDWTVNSFARAWFQTNTMSYAYYNGVLGSGPDVSKMVSLEAGKQYNIEFAVRVMKNKGYEGKKVFEITVDGELLVQYIGCQADLSDNMIFFHGAEGSAYLINKPVSGKHTVTVNVLGKKYTSRAIDGAYFMPEAPKAAGKVFLGFYNGSKKYDGYATGDISLTAKFEDIKYEAYDTITLRDLGVQEKKILNQSNTVYTYDKKAKSGGRLLRFIMEPIGD
ncbi:MAG: tyrosine-protein phosphatase, partial [Clostridia bacterium]|nr:tyrosine-protein phosphatase [Clostridia bacterium]